MLDKCDGASQVCGVRLLGAGTGGRLPAADKALGLNLPLALHFEAALAPQTRVCVKRGQRAKGQHLLCFSEHTICVDHLRAAPWQQEVRHLQASSEVQVWPSASAAPRHTGLGAVAATTQGRPDAGGAKSA